MKLLFASIIVFVTQPVWGQQPANRAPTGVLASCKADNIRLKLTPIPCVVKEARLTLRDGHVYYQGWLELSPSKRNSDGTVTIPMPRGRVTISSESPLPQGGTGTVSGEGSLRNLAPMFQMLPPCAFGLSRVEVITKPKPVIPEPSIDAYVPMPTQPSGYITSEYKLFQPKPPTRMACPYERAIAIYGDERVKYWEPEHLHSKPARVEVCDEDGKSNCVVVYRHKEPQ